MRYCYFHDKFLKGREEKFKIPGHKINNLSIIPIILIIRIPQLSQ